MAGDRALVLRAEAALAAAQLRADAVVRYAEVDLLVAALRDHVRDLQAERDELLRQVAQLRDEARRERARWLGRGLKPPR
ncbi:MAG: hypothetical protein IT304_00995 [Dehalococcoidia bacterium]|nr:hypothetical protein [Dehalococcoidia bacterium]